MIHTSMTNDTLPIPTAFVTQALQPTVSSEQPMIVQNVNNASCPSQSNQQIVQQWEELHMRFSQSWLLLAELLPRSWPGPIPKLLQQEWLCKIL